MTSENKTQTEQKLPLVRARDESGATWDNPDDDQLHDMVAGLNLKNRFLVVNRLDRPNNQYYMQIYLDEMVEGGDDLYQMEYRDGSPDTHYEAQVKCNLFVSGDPVVMVLQQWARGDDKFRTALPWEPLN